MSFLWLLWEAPVKHEPYWREIWFCVITLPLSSCMTLGQLLNLSSLSFLICKMGLRNVASTQGCCENLGVLSW